MTTDRIGRGPAPHEGARSAVTRMLPVSPDRDTTWVVADAEGEPVALSVQDVARLADLARIEMSQEQLATLAPQLEVILESVAVVAQVADQDIPPTSHAIAMTNVFRDDVVTPSWPAEEMLAGAPAVEDSQFRAPRILDEEA